MGRWVIMCNNNILKRLPIIGQTGDGQLSSIIIVHKTE